MSSKSIPNRFFQGLLILLALILFPAQSNSQSPAPTGQAESLKTLFQTGHTAWTMGIRFRDDEKLFASLDESGAVKVWRTSDGRLLANWTVDLSLHPENFIWDQFWFDGRQNLVFNNLDQGQWHTTVYETFSGKRLDNRVTPLPDRTVEDLSDDGRVLAFRVENAAGRLPSLELRRTSNLGVMAAFDIPDGEPVRVYLSPTGKYLAVGTKERAMDAPPGQVYAWRTSDQTAFGPFPLNNDLLGVSDQGTVVVASEGKIDFRRITDWSSVRGFQYPGLADFGSFSPNGRNFIAMSRSSLEWRLWDLESEKIVLSHETYADISSFVPDAVFSPSGTYLALKGPAHQGSGGFFFSPALGLWDLEHNRGGPITDAGRRVHDPRFSMAGDYLVVIEDLDGERFEEYARANIWDIRDGKLLSQWSGGQECLGAVLSPDGEYLAALSANSELFVWRLPDMELIHQYQIGDMDFGKWVQGLALGPGGNIAAVPGPDVSSIQVIDLAKRRVAAKLVDNNREFLNKIVISPNGRYLAEDSSHPTPDNKDAQNSATVWDIAAKRKIANVALEPYTLLGFSPDSQYLLADTKVYLLPKGKPAGDISGFKEKDASLWAYSYSQALAGAGRIMAETVGGGEGVRIKDAVTGEIRASLYKIENGYLALTPEGFFAGTGDFNRYVHYVRGTDVFEFNQFYDAFYRPDLVQKKLRGEDISPFTQGLNIEAALNEPPPAVDILSPDANSRSKTRKISVKLRVKDMGGGIGDIRLFHNGKLVQSRGVYRVAKQTPEPEPGAKPAYDVYHMARRGVVLVEARARPEKSTPDKHKLEWSDVRASDRVAQQTYDVELVKGANTIAVAAFNGPNTVMSAIRSVTVNADVPARPPRLFALVVGTNEYKGAPLLEYAVKDAHDMAALIQQAGPRMFTDVFLTLLDDPTKDQILTAMEKAGTDMTPEDVFLFYSASHGVADDDLYYLICSDYAGGHPSSGGAISSMELMEYSKRIPALKNIFILDTCQSGSVGAIVSGLYDARIAVLAKSLGMHILAGAKSGQGAIDNYQGNGLFTHFVLQGLKGAADQNQDKQINIFEMTPFLQTKVAEASQGSQSAFIRNFGDDFPLIKLP